MIYKYDEKIVNNGKAFFDEKNFVGYILPDGNIYACKNHNVSNIDTFLKMYLNLLDNSYDNKDELLDIDTDDKLARIVLTYLKHMSHDEIIALRKFIESNSLTISDLLVSLFNCHLVTRMKKEILTSEVDHQCFYNYLLHDFKIVTIDKIMYDVENKNYRFINGNSRNDYLYDEIVKIKSEVSEKDIDLFYKHSR